MNKLEYLITEARKQRKIEKDKTTPATLLYSFLFKWHTGKAVVRRKYSFIKEWFPFKAFRKINEAAEMDALLQFMKSDTIAKALVSNMERAGISIAKDIDFYGGDTKVKKLPYEKVTIEERPAPAYDAIKIVDEIENKELDKQDI